MIRKKTKKVKEFLCPYCNVWVEERDCNYHLVAEHDVDIRDMEHLKERFQYLGGIDFREKTVDII